MKRHGGLRWRRVVRFCVEFVVAYTILATAAAGVFPGLNDVEDPATVGSIIVVLVAASLFVVVASDRQRISSRAGACGKSESADSDNYT